MSTYNNPIYANIPGNTQGNEWRNVWSLTRTMKKAGWKYKGSSGGYTTTSTSNGVTLPQATINCVDNTSFPSSGTLYIQTTGVGGGQETAVTYTSKPGSTSFGGCSGGTGTLSTGNCITTVRVDRSTDPRLDQWGPGTVTNAGAGGAQVTVVARGRATVTGLSGITSADKGRFLVLASSSVSANNNYHQIETIISATSVTIDARNFVVAADTGSDTWSIVDPLSDSWTTYGYPISNYYGWWCAEGPGIIKVPITVAPVQGTSDFVRGENITQANTGFTGELVSYTWDAASSTGWLVISPRVRGTGAGRYGLSVTTDALTGDLSGTTVLGVNQGTPLEYREQQVFYKQSNNTSGWLSCGFFEMVSESTATFSALVSSTGCTASAAPGTGGTGNSFPTHAGLVRGSSTGTGLAPSVGFYNWAAPSSTFVIGQGLVICIDCIEELGYSADGTWMMAYANIHSQSYGESEWLSFQRANDVEEGDIHPFIYVTNTNTSSGMHAVGERTAMNNSSSQQFSNSTCSTWAYYTSCAMRGWRARGQASEQWDTFEHAYLYAPVSNAQNSSIAVGRFNVIVPETLACAAGTKKVREPIWAVSLSSGVTLHYRKGTLRWAYWIQGGQRFNTIDSKKWIQLGCGYYGYTGLQIGYCCVVLGGWDGSTVQFAL